jgi:hypothetical protein
MVVDPVQELAPDTVQVPVPVFLTVPAPLITPE